LLDVVKLSVAQLKAELKKRGRVTGGNKSILQVRLKEAIDLNVPVSDKAGGDVAPRPSVHGGVRCNGEAGVAVLVQRSRL
jgi:hypothetical protein